MQGFVPSQLMMEITTSFQGLGNVEKGSIPLKGMSIGETPPTSNGTTGKVHFLYQGDRIGETSTKDFGIPCKGTSPLKVCHKTIQTPLRCILVHRSLTLAKETMVFTRTMVSR
jgi:hypothetical protein